MSKSMYQAKLTGLVKDGNDWVEAKTHQADGVVLFRGVDAKIGTFYVNHRIEGAPVLITSKGNYPLSWMPQGYYIPDDAPVKIHVTLKKITGKLIYWA